MTGYRKPSRRTTATRPRHTGRPRSIEHGALITITSVGGTRHRAVHWSEADSEDEAERADSESMRDLCQWVEEASGYRTRGKWAAAKVFYLVGPGSGRDDLKQDWCPWCGLSYHDDETGPAEGQPGQEQDR